MNTHKQKVWLNSMFSQHSQIEDNEPKLKKYKKDVTSARKSTKRAGILQQEENEICLEIKKESCKESNNSESGLQKSSISNKTNRTATHEANENWMEFFAPTSSEELAIHPKKLQEVKQWFQHCIAMKSKKPAQMCLLTGPSGSGKTAAVRTLAKENKFSIQEWINPVDQETVYNLGDQLQRQSFFTSQIDSFKYFLFKASRYRTLFETNAENKYLLIVEDFPNFLKDSATLNEILDCYVDYATSPLIFIVTDAKTRGLNISYNVFTDEIKQKFLINHISFNAIASSIMKKAMNRFCALMHSSTYCQIYKTPPADIIESIVTSAQGDIRSALTNLHFSSLKGAPNLLTQRIQCIEAKPSKKRKAECKLKSVGRDDSVTLMHALGRVFNPKFTEDKRFVHSPEELAEAFITEPKKFIDLVRINYIAHFSDIEEVLEAADGLSLCDVILNEYRDDLLPLIGLNVGIRNVMLANMNPITGWMPIKGQKRELNKTKVLSHASQILPENHNVTLSQYTLDYKTFVNILPQNVP